MVDEVVGALELVDPAVPVVVGPPFQVKVPAAPCYVVNLPSIDTSIGVGDCRVLTGSVDVVCVPSVATNRQQLLDMAENAALAVDYTVTAGLIEESPFTDVDDVLVYRLTFTY
jgi:hypothetical protein